MKKMNEVIKEDYQELVEEAYEDLVGYIKNSYTEEKILKKMRRIENYTDEIIDAARKLYSQRHSSAFGSSIIRGERYKDRLNWYTPIETPHPESRWGKLTSVLKHKGWEDTHIDSLDEQSNDVVSSLASPKSPEPTSVKGLVIGYVQSGKTANFSATIAKATDEGYRLIIVLSGMYNNLRYQTEKRLRSELTDPHRGGKNFNLTEMEKDGDFKKPPFHPNSVLNNKDKFTLVVLKKNQSPLKKFLNWIKDTDIEVMRDSPVLIIDDEADQASVNNARKDGQITKINSLIRDIMTYFNDKTTCSYVGYTATPFANILIDAQEDGDLFPRDFIIALKAPGTYVGAERLFGRASVDMDGGESGLNIIRPIDISESISDDNDSVEDRMSLSMRKAILSFLLASGERIRRQHRTKHITMLIHTSHLREQHRIVFSYVERFLKEVEMLIDDKNEDLTNELQDLWKTDFVKTNHNDFATEKLGEFSEVIEGLEFFMKDLKVIKENSESEFRLEFDQGTVWAVVVGGNTLSRGLTVEGLTTTYFHRTTSGYDTLLQMGRWFGYRPNYLDLVRVYVTPEMESHFYHIATVEQELREDIIRMQASDPPERPIDIALKIRDHDTLNITNKVVLKKNATIASNSYSGSKIQASHIFLENKKWAEHNFSTIKNLLATLEGKDKRSQISFPIFRRCLLYKNVDSSDVLNFLKSYDFSEADKKYNFDLMGKYISNLNEKGELTNWSIAVMSRNDIDEKKKMDLEVNNLSVYSVERRESTSISYDKEKYGSVIRYVTVMRDELIDLDDLEDVNVGTILEDSTIKESIYPIRNKRPTDRGLLLIYPIHTHYNSSNEEREKICEGKKLRPVISDIDKMFAITMVFPSTKQEKFEFNYVSNVTVARQE
jgi:hypothetical protein